MTNILQDAKLYSAWVNLKWFHPSQVPATFAEFNAEVECSFASGEDFVLPITTPKRVTNITISKTDLSCTVRSGTRSFVLDELNYTLSCTVTTRVPPKELYRYSSSESIQLGVKGIYLYVEDTLSDLIKCDWPTPIRPWLPEIKLVQKPLELIHIISDFGGGAQLYLMIGETKILGLITPPKKELPDNAFIDTNY